MVLRLRPIFYGVNEAQRLNRLIIIAFLMPSIFACATVTTMKQKSTPKVDTHIWHEEPQGHIKAVVLLLHGLNLKPRRMDDWAHLLSEHGAHVIRFALYGHTGDKAHMGTVTADMWRAQFIDAITEALAMSAQHKVPIYFVGFSLGGLVGLEWLAHKSPEIKGFDKMALIAPALSVPWFSEAAIRSLSIFGRGFMLPSRSPEDYRANNGTSIAAYLALFELKDSLFKQGFKNTNIETLLVMDKNDELISSKSIRKTIWENRLNAWKLEIVDNRYAHDNYGFRHLMVDKEAVGSELWASLSQMILDHFGL